MGELYCFWNQDNRTIDIGENVFPKQSFRLLFSRYGGFWGKKLNFSLIALGFSRTMEEFSGLRNPLGRTPPEDSSNGATCPKVSFLVRPTRRFPPVVRPTRRLLLWYDLRRVKNSIKLYIIHFCRPKHGSIKNGQTPQKLFFTIILENNGFFPEKNC